MCFLVEYKIKAKLQQLLCIKIHIGCYLLNLFWNVFGGVFAPYDTVPLMMAIFYAFGVGPYSHSCLFYHWLGWCIENAIQACQYCCPKNKPN